MGYAVELYFDNDSEKKIISIWKALYENRISDFMYKSNSKPHITLSVYDDRVFQNDKFKENIRYYSNLINKFNLTLSNIGMFNTNEGVVFLAPKVTPQLLSIHNDFHKHMKEFEKNEWTYYQPSNWIPHCTMALDIQRNKVLESIELISDMFEPMKIRVERLGIVKFKPIEYIEVFELEDESLLLKEKQLT